VFELATIGIQTLSKPPNCCKSVYIFWAILYSQFMMHGQKNIKISDFIYDILDLVQILWIILLIFVFNCSFPFNPLLGIISNVF